MSIGNLITALYSLLIACVMLMILVLAPLTIWADIALGSVVQNAARVAAVTQDQVQVQNEIALDLQNNNLPTTMNGHTLFALTNIGQPTSNATGFYLTGQPTSEETSVTIQYDLPMPFDKALTLIGGPALNFTIPITRTGTYYNEQQYTGSVQ